MGRADVSHCKSGPRTIASGSGGICIYEFARSGGNGSCFDRAPFLERLDALENSPDRITTRAQDLEALATLEKRGITQDERQRMRSLLNIAQGLSTTTNTADTRLDDLRALRAWFDDWSETARIVVSRRLYLIRLGLAKRKKSVPPAKPEIPATTTP